MPSVAKCAVNNSNVSSDAKNINLLAILQIFLVPSYLIPHALSIFQVKGDAPRQQQFFNEQQSCPGFIIGGRRNL